MRTCMVVKCSGYDHMNKTDVSQRSLDIIVRIEADELTSIIDSSESYVFHIIATILTNKLFFE